MLESHTQEPSSSEGASMNYVGVLSGVSLLSLPYLVYSIGKIRKTAPSPAPAEASSVRPVLHVIDEEQLAEIVANEPHHVLFHLQSQLSPENHPTPALQPRGITLDELERCLPWIPQDARVVIQSLVGFDHLQRLPTRRALFLVKTFLPASSPLT
jgi:hypothetical protein